MNISIMIPYYNKKNILKTDKNKINISVNYICIYNNSKYKKLETIQQFYITI